MNSQKWIDIVCKHRGLPEVKMGATCEVDGRKGIIVGGNEAGNFNVLFDDMDHVRNCHPHYRMKIFNKHGGVAYESPQLQKR